MEQALFRWSEFICERVHRHPHHRRDQASGESAWLKSRDAKQRRGEAEVALGWSRPTRQIARDGGKVAGIVGPGGAFGGTLQDSPTAPGLEPLAPPDPSDLPNNHLAYAGQWFFFALTALVIYVLALRKKWRSGTQP